MADDANNIIGCFASIYAGKYDDSQNKKDLALEQGHLFREYIWGKNGIKETLSPLKKDTYGNDITLILLEFSVNPPPEVIKLLKEVGSYRKKEKSIGLRIIIDNNNFFSKTELERQHFIKNTLIQKIDLLTNVVSKKKLDTNIELLKSDLQKLLN